ncbi:MAG: xanthine dehydrogenase family protein molybdopterin-binding subunit [Saprospiraceae bacterium]|nr:xanthine dehydrogenase family protein molybdopterin-binding subunit [Saprospiraceae bacterium]
MTIIKTSFGRRSFIKSTALAGGGMMLGFSWLASCKPSSGDLITLPKEWFNINGFLKIGENGIVTIMSPNPEIGQNIKTSMPMIVAEELDIDWKNVIVEQAPLDTAIFTRQIAGGSQSIRQGWEGLRMAGATARHMLKEAAAKAWSISVDEVTTEAGILSHKASGKSAGYGEMASAAAKIIVPKEVKLKEKKDFKIIGTSRNNVDGQKIVTGKPLFGIDYTQEGMLVAMIAHPPAFGLKLKSFDDGEARSMPGIKDVIKINVFENDYELQWCDTISFNELVVVIGNSTWEVMNAKKALKLEWEANNDVKDVTLKDLESTEIHSKKMKSAALTSSKVVRKDGDPLKMFKKAAKIIERSYTAPFLAHSTLEPMNFFANVTAEKAELVGPIQTPEYMEKSVAERLGLPLEKIDIKMTRMGGGFGRRLYGHFLVEAAVISQKMKAPVKLIYSREDDMTTGIYRPAYQATYKAGLDANKNLIAFHVRCGGVGESPLSANRFPAGAVDNYLAEEWQVSSNISVGAFRAPGSNFIAGAEQAFLDELAEEMGKDPLALRLELLARAEKNPVGKDNDYDPKRYAGVLELVKEKASWGTKSAGIHRGLAAYFCHNTYVAQVLDIEMVDNIPVIRKVTAAVDCGIVVNPVAAANLTEGGIIDGIGHSMYSAITIKDGVPQQNNFNTYRLIRHNEAPKEIEVFFVSNDIDPTGLGEPINPPIIGALANALYKATGKRFYDQPFVGQQNIIG